MIFFNDSIIIEDSLDNLYLFTLYDGVITKYFFKNETDIVDKTNIIEDAFKTYDISVDEENIIYIIYQDKNYHLKLMTIGEEIQEIVLTEEPMPEVFNLNLKIIDKKPHIFYCVLLSDINRQYRIIHHWYNGELWLTNIVEDIRINQVLNPINVLKYKDEIILVYYHNKNNEKIYFTSFNLIEEKWGEKHQITNSDVSKLYLDSIFIGDRLHLVYCEYKENLVVKYERYGYQNGFLNKEIEEELSNWENTSWPTLIYFENKLWVIWAEYDNIMSRYSLDGGTNWSPIYLWKDYKHADIIRYKYISQNSMDNILNYSFGTINPVMLIGFGYLKNIVEIPVKKNMEIEF